MKILQICLPHLSVVTTLPWKSRKSFFNIIIHILQIIYVTSEENKYQLLYRSFSCLLTVVCASCPSTASGVRCRRNACIDTDMSRLAATAACCDMGWISAQRGVLCERLETCIHADSDHAVHLRAHRLFDIQLPHITTCSFQSHRRQPKTGSLQSFWRLKECNKPSIGWKSFAI